MPQFASDTFTGTEGTELTAYNAAWTRHTSYTGNSEIASNRVRPSANVLSAYYHSGAPASADYSVSADFYVHVTDGGPSSTSICGRMSTSANTMYLANYFGSTTDKWSLAKIVAGTFTTLVSSAASLAAGSTHNVRLEMIGSEIKLYLNGSGTPLLSVTDTAITAAGKAGIRLSANETPTDTTGINIDNFSADDAATAAELAGVSVSVATATGALTTGIPFAVSATVQATANGDLSAQIKFDGAALSQAIAAGGLSTGIPLLASAINAATATGDLTGGSGLSASASAIAGALGNLTTSISLQGAAVAEALAAAGLTVGAGLGGDASSSATAAGQIITGIPLAGVAQAYATAAGNVTTLINLAGAAAAVNSATGALTVSITMQGTALADALASGQITAQIKLDGAALARAAATGALTDSVAYTASPSRTRLIPAEYRTRLIPAEYRIRGIAA